MEDEPVVILEGVSEFLPDRSGASGPMALFKSGQRFCLSWVPDRSSPIHSIFQSTQGSNAWEPLRSFRFPLDQLTSISFTPDPLQFTLAAKSRGLARIFRCKKNGLFLLSILVEQLLLRGLVIVSGEYSLSFCELIGRHFLLPTFDLQSQFFESFPEFWEGVRRLSSQLFRAFDHPALRSKLRLKPVLDAVMVNHALLIEMITRGCASFQAPSITDVQSIFNPDGSIGDPLSVRRSLYFNGIELAQLAQILPFLVGLFPWSSTADERNSRMIELSRDYDRLSMQLDSISQAQLPLNRELASSFRVVSQDIVRPERSMEGFQTRDALGNVWSRRLLQMYCLYQPSVPFYQGMNDMLQPVILALFQDWDWSVADGSEMVLPLAFWCFDALLETTNQFVFLQNVLIGCRSVVKLVHTVLGEVAPDLLVWMRMTGLEKLMWMHSDLALLFKRTFRGIWSLWIQLLASPDPRHWVAYLTTAFLVMTLPRVIEMPEITLASLGEEFPDFLRALNFTEVARVAMWLYEKAPAEPDVIAEPTDAPACEFFAPE
jgi:hypothetical protein